jgi:CPA2 family monovalent cation:H+ antiporter-2
VILGYGRSGQAMARVLEHEDIPYMALDLDPDRVRQAQAAGQSVAFGDAAKPQALVAAGIKRANAVVITYLELPSALKALAVIRGVAPHLPVLVRTQTDRDLDKLREAGATEIVPESMEGSLMLAGHALALVGVPMRRVIRVVQEQREQRYGMLRGYFHGADDASDDEMAEERLHTFELSEAVAGHTLADLLVGAGELRVIRLRLRDGHPVPSDEHDAPLQGSETLVLSGKAEALARAEKALRV